MILLQNKTWHSYRYMKANLTQPNHTAFIQLKDLTMKKSILASLFAGLFAVSAFAGDDVHMMKIELKKELGEGTTLNINQDGNTQVFEFTEQELQDDDVVNARLEGLDDDTKETVLNALNGVHLDGNNQMFIDEEVHNKDGNKFVFISTDELVDGDEPHKVIIDMQSSHDSKGLHKVFKHKGGDGFAFQFGNGGNGANRVMLHKDSDQAADVIQKLLEHSELSASQVDQIQQALDTKR